MTKILVVEDLVSFSDGLTLVLGRRFSDGGHGAAEYGRAVTVAEGLDLISDSAPSTWRWWT